MEHLRKLTEGFMEYAERLLTNRKDYDLDKIEVYELLYGTQVSSDHARKCLTNLQMTIDEYNKSNIDKQICDSNIINITFIPSTNLEKELTKNYKETVEINKDGTQSSDKLIIMNQEEAKDVNFLLEKHGFSNLVWELVSCRNNIWNVANKQDGILTLYSSKIVVKPRITKFNPKWVKEVLENLDLDSPVIDTKPYNITGKTLEINLADVHIDKLCNIDETRNEYSTEIGIQRLWQVINDIIEKVKYYNIKKILIPFGQDISNIDNMFNTTTKGTSQDTDVKYDVLYKILLKNIIQIIHKLSEIAPVDIIYVGGNHDKLTSFTMTEAMYWHFLNNDNVEVDSIFNNRKYRLIGGNLLGFAHGADEKRNIIYCMQNDVPELWGKSKYREFHLSHFHKEKMIDEQNGIIFRWISAICGNDAWTYNNGYVGSQKKAQAFIWDDEKGLECIINSYV